MVGYHYRSSNFPSFAEVCGTRGGDKLASGYMLMGPLIGGCQVRVPPRASLCAGGWIGSIWMMLQATRGPGIPLGFLPDPYGSLI